MPITIADNGRNNRIDIDPAVAETSDAVLLLHGCNNQVTIARGVTLSQARITLGEACSLSIGTSCRLAAIEIAADHDAHVTIGERTEFTWSSRLYLHEPARIDIGAGCLIASETLMMASDMHSIIDLETSKRINPAADIVIFDKVWLGHESTVLKGASIGSGSVIGYRSIVNSAVPENSLAVGSPARVVRRGISWDRRLL